MERCEGTLHEKQVIVLGGSSGIGLETARLADAQGAKLVLVARDVHKLEAASHALGGSARTAIFDVADEGAVRTFFEHIGRIDHVLLAAGNPFYAPLVQMNFSEARRYIDNRILSILYIARYAGPHMVPAGSLIFLSGTLIQRPALGLSVTSIAGHATGTLTKNLALELAPTRVNTIACGFVDTPLSAALLGEGLQARREELERTLPIHRVVQPEDVAKLAVHLMLNTAITGSTYAIDGGQSLL
ncbi:short-chain dehydrogenase [Dictyobacter alpinus]|uniref:Short-chain dehydrogenase n=1 Tax=Dictyobacter alpinus TaxID=2014873 RepID=A0A402BKS4_9CHLR|nr:SDR family oxidoreductase [Dictyobacter alpinus]GCE31929.1 short-chain dehydrogenase [Dictyobacter alpinus]